MTFSGIAGGFDGARFLGAFGFGASAATALAVDFGAAFAAVFFAGLVLAFALGSDAALETDFGAAFTADFGDGLGAVAAGLGAGFGLVAIGLTSAAPSFATNLTLVAFEAAGFLAALDFFAIGGRGFEAAACKLRIGANGAWIIAPVIMCIISIWVVSA